MCGPTLRCVSGLYGDELTFLVGKLFEDELIPFFMLGVLSHQISGHLMHIDRTIFRSGRHDRIHDRIVFIERLAVFVVSNGDLGELRTYQFHAAGRTVVAATHESFHAIITERTLTACNGDLGRKDVSTTVATDIRSEDSLATNNWTVRWSTASTAVSIISTSC